MMLDVEGRTVAAPEESLAAQDEELGRERLNARYRGIYIGRSIVRGAEHVEELIGPPPPLWRRSLDSLYRNRSARRCSSAGDSSGSSHSSGRSPPVSSWPPTGRSAIAAARCGSATCPR